MEESAPISEESGGEMEAELPMEQASEARMDAAAAAHEDEAGWVMVDKGVQRFAHDHRRDRCPDPGVQVLTPDRQLTLQPQAVHPSNFRTLSWQQGS